LFSERCDPLAIITELQPMAVIFSVAEDYLAANSTAIARREETVRGRV